MARKQGTRGGARGGSGAGGQGSAGAVAPVITQTEPAAPKKRTNPLQFIREVRAEARKVTWTSRKETWITSVMVFIMVTLAVIFFAIIDLILGWGVSQFIQLGR